ncbi:MAG: hypothetical protein Q9222_007484 [Ikaeria aurantiellina]
MQPSRIAHDLITSGFDTAIHLAIAEQSLDHIQDLQTDLPAMEAELKDMARILRHSSQDAGLMERLGKLGEEFKELKRELEGAPKVIEALETDIALLRRYFATVNGDEVQGGANTTLAKSMGNEKTEDGRKET